MRTHEAETRGATHTAQSARWTSAPRRSCGPSSRNTSRPRRRSARQALVERYGLGVSSATVRNILAELEAPGC